MSKSHTAVPAIQISTFGSEISRFNFWPGDRVTLCNDYTMEGRKLRFRRQPEHGPRDEDEQHLEDTKFSYDTTVEEGGGPWLSMEQVGLGGSEWLGPNQERTFVVQERGHVEWKDAVEDSSAGTQKSGE